MPRSPVLALVLALAASTSALADGPAPIRPVPLVPRSGDVTLLDFEDGRIPRFATDPWGLQFFVANQYNSGVYTWAIDDTTGANGTRRSLRLDVQQGQFYFYWLSNDRRLWLDAARGQNRMSFWLKLPRGWGAGVDRYQNFNVGTYLRDRRVPGPGQVESKNNHHYFQLFLVPDGEWMHVVVGDSPHHQRSMPQIDPAKTSWRPDIPRFYDALTRFYICGAPNKGADPLPGAYQAWFDELSFYYEDERVVCHPEYSIRHGEPGKLVYHPLRVTNTHPTEKRRFAYSLTSNEDRAWPVDAALLRDANGNGRRDGGEDWTVLQSPLLAPGESDHLLLVERVPQVASASARRRTNFLAYQVEPPVKPVDPRVQNRSIHGARGEQTTPSAGCLCVTEVGAVAAGDTRPARIADLAARALSPSTAELTWTAPGPVPGFAYDVRVALAPIETAEEFARAMPLPDAPAPGVPGVAETMTVSGLRPDLTYYFTVVTEDAAGNRSAPAASTRD
jgi:hypothetical protein